MPQEEALQAVRTQHEERVAADYRLTQTLRRMLSARRIPAAGGK
jgi:hypothetical protein